MFLQLITNGIVMGSIYGIVALGFALVYNTTRTFHIAFAALYAFSPYIVLSLFSSLGFPLFPSIITAIAVTALVSLFIEKTVYQPLVKKSSSLNVIMISSLGVMIVIINGIAMIYGNETKILNTAISKSISVGNIILTHTQITQLIVSIIIFLSFFTFLKYSQFGIKTRALRDDNILFGVFGQNIIKMRTLLFLLSGILVSIGSIMVAYDVGFDPYVGMPMLLNAIVALIIGGIGRFEAPIIGGLVIGVLQSSAVWAFSARWQDAITFILLILFLLFRPQGLLGEKQRAV